MNRLTRTQGLVVAATVLAVVAATLISLGLARQQPAPPEAPEAGVNSAPTRSVPSPTSPASPESGAPEQVRGPVLPASEPARITIPSLDAGSALERLGRDANGAMETPRNPDRAGWYTPGPTPGEQGPAVIAGHVTWNGDRSVFFRLGELREGDRVEVTREDGRTAEFAVDRIARYPKDEFPTVEVYRNLDHAGLRLITCGGDYDEGTNRYADNVVVFASLTGSHR